MARRGRICSADTTSSAPDSSARAALRARAHKGRHRRTGSDRPPSPRGRTSRNSGSRARRRGWCRRAETVRSTPSCRDSRRPRPRRRTRQEARARGSSRGFSGRDAWRAMVQLCASVVANPLLVIPAERSESRDPVNTGHAITLCRCLLDHGLPLRVGRMTARPRRSRSSAPSRRARAGRGFRAAGRSRCPRRRASRRRCAA